MQVCHNNVPISSKTSTTLLEYASHSTIIGCMYHVPLMLINPIMVSICPHVFVCTCNRVWKARKMCHIKVNTHPISSLHPYNVQKPSCKCWDIMCQVIWPLHNPSCSTPTHCPSMKFHTISLQCRACFLPLFAPTLYLHYTILDNYHYRLPHITNPWSSLDHLH